MTSLWRAPLQFLPNVHKFCGTGYSEQGSPGAVEFSNYSSWKWDFLITYVKKDEIN
jgi:hypothetical protein